MSACRPRLWVIRSVVCKRLPSVLRQVRRSFNVLGICTHLDHVRYDEYKLLGLRFELAYLA